MPQLAIVVDTSVLVMAGMSKNPNFAKDLLQLVLTDQIKAQYLATLDSRDLLFMISRIIQKQVESWINKGKVINLKTRLKNY